MGWLMKNKFANKILVIDDDPFVLKLVSHMLKDQGCVSVTTCDNGFAALKILDSQSEHPDLIFLDLKMPNMDGLEFIRHLAECHYSGSIILMSGEDDTLLEAADKLVRAHEVSVLGRFDKPASPEVLAALLEKFPLVYPNSLRGGKDAHSASDLLAAINNGDLINYYQPKVSVYSGRIVGVEALVRWRDSQNGMVHPDKFLGIAESSGLIHDLTRTILTNALDQYKVWLAEGLSFQLAINVSVYNLKSLEFADSVSALTTAAGVAAENIELEVAESWLPMDDLRATLETLTRLHMKHFRLTIDEFGTGYSSILQLRGLPFDELKIDSGFVHHISTNAKTRATYDANLAIARQLNMKVGAVGVENIGEWDVLRLTGCDYAQGSFIANPMPAEELADWMQVWQSRLQNERLVTDDEPRD